MVIKPAIVATLRVFREYNKNLAFTESRLLKNIDSSRETGKINPSKTGMEQIIDAPHAFIPFKSNRWILLNRFVAFV
jgi:hypothetical protein